MEDKTYTCDFTISVHSSSPIKEYVCVDVCFGAIKAIYPDCEIVGSPGSTREEGPELPMTPEERERYNQLRNKLL